MPELHEKTCADMVSWSLTQSKPDLDQSSVDSLFRYADQLVKEATDQAKETIKEELSLSFISNSTIDLNDEISTPEDACEAKEPGKMIDMYMKDYVPTGNENSMGVEEVEICEWKSMKSNLGEQLHSKQSEMFHADKCENSKRNDSSLTVHRDKYSHMSIVSPSKDLQGSAVGFDFDPLLIETSSVDENSYTKQSFRDDPNELDDTEVTYGDISQDVHVLSENGRAGSGRQLGEALAHSKPPQEKGQSESSSKQFSAHTSIKYDAEQSALRNVNTTRTECQFLESSGSIATEDIEELLSYGKTLRKDHSGGYNISTSFEDEDSLIGREYSSRNAGEYSSKTAGEYPSKNESEYSKQTFSRQPDRCRENAFEDNTPEMQDFGSYHQNYSKGLQINETGATSSTRSEVGSFDESLDTTLVNARLKLPTFSFSIDETEQSVTASHVYGSHDDDDNDDEVDDSFLKRRRPSSFNSISFDSGLIGLQRETTQSDRQHDDNNKLSARESSEWNPIRTRSRSWSPMQRSASKRPRSHSASSVVVPLSLRSSHRRFSCKTQDRFSGLGESSDYTVENLATKLQAVQRYEQFKETSKQSLARDSTNDSSRRNEGVGCGGRLNRAPPPVPPKPNRFQSHLNADQPASKSYALDGRHASGAGTKQMNMMREECASLERQLKVGFCRLFGLILYFYYILTFQTLIVRGTVQFQFLNLCLFYTLRIEQLWKKINYSL